ncbi:MAG: hypothetical protein IBJ03_09475 [Gemmatimonadaceae bacterium]|nr:hypothetical protein [Gemmatimonadaceae bacterium]
MSTMPNPSPHTTDDCVRFEATLGPWLERDTDGNTNEWMTAHRDSCPMCAALVADLEQLVSDAAALPPIAPSRDLWADIESRLEAQVIPIGRGIAAAPLIAAPVATSTAKTPSTRTFGIRTLAIAATLLVAVSSGVTWQLTRPSGSSRPMVDESNVAVQPSTDSLTDTSRAPSTVVASNTDSITPATSRTTGTSNTRLVVDDDLPDVDATYEREIRGLRNIVDERFAELDTSTVNELRRNLDIIDRAISDSKAALARDPRSALLSTQLDRALEAKLQLMRRVALL